MYFIKFLGSDSEKSSEDLNVNNIFNILYYRNNKSKNLRSSYWKQINILKA